MKKAISIIGKLAGDLMLLAAVVLGVLLVGVRLFGLKPFTVLSGSMEPTYMTGSMIYVKEVEETRNLAAGTVISFMIDSDTVVTHRIVAAVPDENDSSVIRYRTKGDANDFEDGSLVHYKNIIGVPVFTVPFLGYFTNYIQSPPGCYVAMSAGALLLLLMFLPELLGAIFSAEEPAPKKKKGPAPKKESKREMSPRRERRQSPPPRYEYEPEESEPEYYPEESPAYSPQPLPEPYPTAPAPERQSGYCRHGVKYSDCSQAQCGRCCEQMGHAESAPSRRQPSISPEYYEEKPASSSRSETRKRRGGAHLAEKPRRR